MELKPGYKMTEVGVIPEDWTEKKLNELGAFIKGKGISRTEANSGILPCIRYGEIYTHHNNIIKNFYSFISYDIAQKSVHIKPGDILFTCSGETKEEIGKCVAFIFNIEAYAGGDIIILRNTSENSIFLGYRLNAHDVSLQKSTLGQGDAVVHISTSALGNINVTLPVDKTEQQAIAAALSDVDELLSSLDRLIAKKKDIRRATMQELLTGKKRLPGFSESWQEITLGELGFFIKGKGISRAEANSGLIPCIRYGEIYTHHNNIIKNFYSFISHEAAQKSVLLKSGDILFTCSGETKEDIGKSVAFITNIEAYAGGDIIILRNTSEDSKFLGYRLNANDIVLQKSSAGQGDAVVHISTTSLSNICVTLPKDRTEQQAIASVLSDMDAEIEALEARRDKVRDIKAGMMQELLTGKTRLVGTGETA